MHVSFHAPHQRHAAPRRYRLSAPPDPSRPIAQRLEALFCGLVLTAGAWLIFFA